MPRLAASSGLPGELVLGTRIARSVPEADQTRQRAEIHEILHRLTTQPGVVLADEVGMGKTFVALGVAYATATRTLVGPVVVMAPPNLLEKWEQDLVTFCELYLDDRQPRRIGQATRVELTARTALRYGVARHSVELMRLLDDPPRERASIIFLAQGAMTRRQGDKWIRLALIAQALRTHARGRASRLIQVKAQIHRFLGELLWAIGEERAHDDGEALWASLLRTDPSSWRQQYNEAAQDEHHLDDDPVPSSVVRALQRVDLKRLAEALEHMPIRARGGEHRVSERVKAARKVLNEVERELWTSVLVRARWRSPLLVMDEAHHLKNPWTTLAKQLQSPESMADLKTGHGALAGAFDRMLFLTATPFQLGHHELVDVLRRVGDVRWDAAALGPHEAFDAQLSTLLERLTESQRSAIALQRCWSRLRPEDDAAADDADADAWWHRLLAASRESLSLRHQAVVDAYHLAKGSRDAAEQALAPWVIRHNKGTHWDGSSIVRRVRIDGAGIGRDGHEANARPVAVGLPIPAGQILPFFLAARSAVTASQDLLGEALCSSYEAFRHTRQHREAAKDDEEAAESPLVTLSSAAWYLDEFDRTLAHTRGATHPKIAATVRQAVDLWEAGEKVLVFAFYRRTCRSLRVHISAEIERRLALRSRTSVDAIRARFFNPGASGRQALDAALEEILQARESSLQQADLSDAQRDTLRHVMRRFLRAETTLVRCFPLADLDGLDEAEVVRGALSCTDASGSSWRHKFDAFIDFLTRCSSNERALSLDAAGTVSTGSSRVVNEEDDADAADDDDEDGETVDALGVTKTLAAVQEVTGGTKRNFRERRMRAFNTPFFPDVLVCSEVMREGVDLQRCCRHVIHHDLAWNPSTIEQRTGRIDRLGCKAQGRASIMVYVPYLAGTADERQYRVMAFREQWFRVVMGQDAVAGLITPDEGGAVRLPEAVSRSLGFTLHLDAGRS